MLSRSCIWSCSMVRLFGMRCANPWQRVVLPVPGGLCSKINGLTSLDPEFLANRTAQSQHFNVAIAFAHCVGWNSQALVTIRIKSPWWSSSKTRLAQSATFNVQVDSGYGTYSSHTPSNLTSGIEVISARGTSSSSSRPLSGV